MNEKDDVSFLPGKSMERQVAQGVSRPQTLSGMLSLGCNRSSFHPLPLWLACNIVKNGVNKHNELLVNVNWHWCVKKGAVAKSSTQC